jgi:hypothetical protein
MKTRPLLLYTESFDRFFTFAGKVWFSPRKLCGLVDHKKSILQSSEREKSAFAKKLGWTKTVHPMLPCKEEAV